MATRKKPAARKPAKKPVRKATRAAAAAAAARAPRAGLAAAPAPAPGIMSAPASGVKVRMYRQGHGDCFLLAFRRGDGSPFYVLIDCGMKKGSNIRHPIADVAADIHASTGGHVHLAVITHEHEDHVSGFLSERGVFETLKIDKLWLAWTEDPDNSLANDLRDEHKDVLIGLTAVANRLNKIAASHQSDKSAERAAGVVEHMLGFSLADGDRPLAAAGKIDGITLKNAMKVIKDRANANQGIDFLEPGEPPLKLDNVPGVRAFVLGPPQNPNSLKSMDPVGDEEFHLAAAAAAQARSFLAAVAGGADSNGTLSDEAHQPFDPHFRIPTAASRQPQAHREFFQKHYGPIDKPDTGDSAWRRIDTDWLRVGEQLALRMGDYINNTSLVLAFELPKTKKVLLFVGDAQRGNWVSWPSLAWDKNSGLNGDEKISCADLLARTVFYKVGHHGSHNATLNKGGLAGMALGSYADDFVAMIPANEAWALDVKPKPWVHPLPAIYEALKKKAKGRVFRLDDVVAKPKANVLSASAWKDFSSRTHQNSLYCEFTVTD